ncbi:MAG: hypothetical protein JNM58_05720 [Xanthomonadaceae bacterium]|nr:hypothetical protein [Xanthomonadaceae bacterium]
MRIDTQFKQTLIATGSVGAILGAISAAFFVLFCFVGEGGDNGPAFFLQFDPVFLGYALAVFLGAIATSVLLFGLLPCGMHQAVRILLARRRRA